MRKSLFIIFCILLTVHLQAQKDTVIFASDPVNKNVLAADVPGDLSIYPIPVRENFFSIKCNKEISFVKVTNIIGQDIYKEKFNSPQSITKILLDNPKRGMYLVTIIFNDGMKVVKRIMIEQTQ